MLFRFIQSRNYTLKQIMESSLSSIKPKPTPKPTCCEKIKILQICSSCPIRVCPQNTCKLELPKITKP